MRSARNPRTRASLCFAGPFVEVSSERTFIPGSLIVRVDPARIGSLEPSSLRMFRWDHAEQRLRLIERSGVGGDGTYVWARIAVPGRYGVIGLSSDPEAAMLIGALAAAREHGQSLAPEERAALHRRICELAQLEAAEGEEALRARCLRLTDPFALPESDLLPRRDAGRWRSVAPEGLPGGAREPAIGPVLTMALGAGDPQRLYVGTRGTGLWRLDRLDASPGWTQLTDSDEPLDIRVVAPATSDPGVLYAADGTGRFLRSDDSGATWKAPGDRAFHGVRRIMVHHGDAARVYAAADRSGGEDEAGLWASTDGGEGWTRRIAGDVTDAAMDPVDPSILFAGVREVGLLRSDVGGDRWVLSMPFVSELVHGGSDIAVALGPESRSAGRMVAVRLGQEVFINRHGGRRPNEPHGGAWVSKGWRGGEAPEGEGALVAADPHDDEALIVVGGEMVRTGTVSAAAGGPWEAIASRARARCLLHDPSRAGLVIRGGDRGLERSSDGGATWLALHEGSEPAPIEHAAVSPEAILAALTPAGLMATRRRGDGAWSTIEATGGRRLRAIVPDPGRPGTFYLLAETLGQVDLNPGDSRVLAHELAGFRASSIGVGPDPDGALLAGTDDRILRLADREDLGARTWEDPGEGWSALPIVAIAFAPGSRGVAYAISGNGDVFHEPDVAREGWGGWTASGAWGVESVGGLVVNPLDERRIYAIAGREIGCSPDRGETWISIRGSGAEALPDAALSAILAHPDDPETLVVASEAGVFVTTDEGAIWQRCDQGIPRSPVVQIGWWGSVLVVVTRGHGAWTRRVPL